MKKIVFELKHLLKINLELVDFPELTSSKKWIRKGIEVLKKYTPGVLKYLSRQEAISSIKNHHIEIRTEKNIDENHVRKRFQLWIHKEKTKRLFFIIIEAIILPFTPILALLPGPNFFFYVPALLFYYHLVSFNGLRKVEVDNLKITVIHKKREKE